MLEDLSLSIRAGEVIAIIGENGCGKTTSIKIIDGFYAPTSGGVRWGGIDPAELQPARTSDAAARSSSRTSCAISSPRWKTLGSATRDHVDVAAVRRAVCRAGAGQLLESLPDGYAIILSKEYTDGTDLSVGQRVAQARAELFPLQANAYP